MQTLYQWHDFGRALLTPVHVAAEATQMLLQNPFLPASYTRFGRTMAAGAELLERVTRRFAKPEFGLHETIIAGKTVAVTEEVVLSKAFCNLLHFKRDTTRHDPKLLVIAPLSGHYATLLRGTVEALLPDHDVYITDWLDARQVPLAKGSFDLDDYIAYLIEFIQLLGSDIHLMAVCQPTVPALVATSILAQRNDAIQPRSMTLMGGPIDTSAASTEVTDLAHKHSLKWFKDAVTTVVPLYYPGAMRQVYPGFVQLGSFMSMNMQRHVSAHLEFFKHLVRGDGDPAEAHRVFYDEYLAVMDVTAEFYLQTVERVFQNHLLPKGKFIWRDVKIDPSQIKQTALLTIEGELDDIAAPGQTLAAHKICTGLKPAQKQILLQPNVGHYGIFNGRKYRELIVPVIRDFIRQHDKVVATSKSPTKKPASAKRK